MSGLGQGGNASITTSVTSAVPKSNATSPSPTTGSGLKSDSSTITISTSSYTTTTSSSSHGVTSTGSSKPTSNQPTTAQLSSPSNDPTPFSGAVVAGVAVAAAVGSALLAFVLTFMFIRSRSKRRRETQRHSEKRQSSGGEKTLLRKSSDNLPNSKHAWEKHLPQPADDNSIRLTVRTLLHQVELHVENFYHDSAAPSSVSEEAQVELQKLGSPFLAKPLTVVLPQARSTTAVIKHCLAQLIVRNINTDVLPDEGQSFLPSEFVALQHAIQRTGSNTSKPAFPESLSRWRVLTSYLYPTPTSDPVYIAARNAAITAAASTVCTAFAPWSVRTHSPAVRFQNLVTIMQSAADAGVMIFAQPAAFHWTWDVDSPVRGGSEGRQIAVTPGLVKVTDDDAKVLSQPQVMVQPVMHGF